MAMVVVVVIVVVPVVVVVVVVAVVVVVVVRVVVVAEVVVAAAVVAVVVLTRRRNGFQLRNSVVSLRMVRLSHSRRSFSSPLPSRKLRSLITSSVSHSRMKSFSSHQCRSRLKPVNVLVSAHSSSSEIKRVTSVSDRRCLVKSPTLSVVH